MRVAALPVVAGLLLSVAAGWGCSRIGVPIPWMLGPLLMLAFLRIAGVNVAAVPGGRQAGQWIVGTALGLYFTPHVLREVAGLWPLLLVGAVFSTVLGYAAGLALARMANIDRTTGIFASVPGGAAEMTVLGERFGARVDQVSAAQSLRILIVVTVIPSAYSLLAVHGVAVYVPGTTLSSARGLALLLAATAAGGVIAAALKVPNAFVLGALAVAIPLTAADINLATVPAPLSNAAQCLLGGALGARFHRDFLRGAPRFVAAVGVTVAGAIVISAAFGWLAAKLAALPVATLILGTAPGGIAEMCITAKVLQLGVPLVTALQVTRVVVLMLGTAPLFAQLRAWNTDDRQRRR